jgi:hypothetical protein
MARLANSKYRSKTHLQEGNLKPAKSMNHARFPRTSRIRRISIPVDSTDARHSEAARARRDSENPQAVEERKRVKRQKRATAHASRQSEARRRNAERLELLASLARVSPAERLHRFATDPALMLDCVSAELIPAQERDLMDLEKDKAVALIKRISRRKGPWGRLQQMLEHRVKAEAGSPASQAQSRDGILNGAS